MFTIDREFFRKLGSYDPGLKLYGAENLELSFKVRTVDAILSSKTEIFSQNCVSSIVTTLVVLLCDYVTDLDVWRSADADALLTRGSRVPTANALHRE